MTPFETFYRDHYRSTLGIALALARDTGTAEDLVQEAFLSAHRRWDRISQYDNPQAWVRRVLINRATSLRRRLGAERRAVDRVGPPQPLQPDLSSETEGVWHEVRKLSRRQQQAVAIYYVGQLSVDEVADVMECSQGSVKSHLHRGPGRPSRTPWPTGTRRSDAFAAAFALVVVTVGVVPLLTGSTGKQLLGDGPAPPPSEESTTPTTTATAPEPPCSSAGVPIPEQTIGLPPAVAKTREAVIAAALKCDLSTLRELAGNGFTTHFGGGDGDDLPLWEEEGRGQLGTLLKLFDMSHAETSHEGRIIYVWPAAHAYES